MNCIKLRVFSGVAFFFMGLISSTTIAQTALQQFAEKCDSEIGITVPQFDCDQGTIVPTTQGGTSVAIPGDTTFTQPASCDRPNVLNSACDPGSKFQVLLNTPDAYAVAHCRRKGSKLKTFGDIAVIQHNKVTGATCFYQSPVFSNGTTPNNVVTAPRTGQSVMSTLGTSSCIQCHDNGSLIRTPYLTQIKTGKDVIPGNGKYGFNQGQPYYHVGSEANKTYSVKTDGAGAQCVVCHDLSIGTRSNTIVRNSAGHLSLTATMSAQLSKSPTSEFAPMWMSLSGPNATTYSQAAYDAANQVVNCANSATNLSNLPNTGSCKVTEKTGKLIKPLSLISEWGKCLDVHYSDYYSASDNAKVQGWNCGDVPNQKFTLREDGTIRLSNAKCLNVGTSIYNGMIVNATSCNGSTNQKWKYDAYLGKITNDSVTGKCLELEGNTASQNGAQIQMWDCNAGSNSKWRAADLKNQKIFSQKSTTSALNIEQGLTAGAIQPGWLSAQWTIEKVTNDIYRIRNTWQNDQFLNIESGSLQSSSILPGWQSALWVVRNRPEAEVGTFENGSHVYTFQNLWQPSKYIIFDNGVLSAGAISNIDDDRAFWKVSDLEPGNNFLLQHSGGMCIHPLYGSSNPAMNTPAILNPLCDTPQSRLAFSLLPNGSLQQNSSGSCLHPEGGSITPSNGTRLVYFPSCSDGAAADAEGNKRTGFEFTANGSIRHKNSGLCVHARGDSPNPTPDTELVLSSGCDTPSLKFRRLPKY